MWEYHNEKVKKNWTLMWEYHKEKVKKKLNTDVRVPQRKSKKNWTLMWEYHKEKVRKIEHWCESNITKK